MSTGNMNLTLKIWRQKNTKDQGKMVDYKVSEISPDMSFLEMFDVLNEDLITKGDDPIAFDHDCREGICGMCSMFINGRPHGPVSYTHLDVYKRQGYGFAIPVNLAKKILEDFRQYGVVKRGYIGVTFQALDSEVAERLKVKDINGLYVNSVSPNGAAAAAGIKEGDIIKRVSGVETVSYTHLDVYKRQNL